MARPLGIAYAGENQWGASVGQRRPQALSGM